MGLSLLPLPHVAFFLHQRGKALVTVPSLTSPPITLRWYQQQIVDEVLAATYDGLTKMVFESPTGSGKSNVILALAQAFLANPQAYACIVLPSIALTVQTFESALNWFPREEIGVIQADMNEIGRRLTLASVDTLARLERYEQVRDWMNAIGIEGFTAMFFDESHGSLVEKYSIVAGLEHPYGTRIGPTATPFRHDRQSLLKFYPDGLVSYVDMLDLIEEGYLVRPYGYLIDTNADLKQIRGYKESSEQEEDYSDVDPALLKQLKQFDRYEKDYQAWKNIAGGCPHLILADSITDCYGFQEHYQKQHNIPCEVITGKTSTDRRELLKKQSEQGDLPVVISYGVMITGVDWPWLGCITWGRFSIMGNNPNKVVHAQGTGRGTRPYPGKDRLYVLYLTDEDHRTPPILESSGILRGSLHEHAAKGTSPFEVKEEDASEEGQEEETLTRLEPEQLNAYLKEMNVKARDIFGANGWHETMTRDFELQTKYGTLHANRQGNGKYSLSITHAQSGMTTQLEDGKSYDADIARAKGSQYVKRKSDLEALGQGEQLRVGARKIAKGELDYLKLRGVIIRPESDKNHATTTLTLAHYARAQKHFETYQHNNVPWGERLYFDGGQDYTKTVYPRTPKGKRTASKKGDKAS